MDIGNSFKALPWVLIMDGVSFPKEGNPPKSLPAGKTEESLVMPHSDRMSKTHLLSSPIEKAGAL